MKRYLAPQLGIAAALALGVVPGCTATPEVEIFNSTERAFHLFHDQRSEVVEVGKVVTIEYADQDPEGIRLCLGGTAYRYAIPFPPAEFYHGLGFLFLRYRIRLQVNSDARVRILRKGDSFPVRAEDPQPEPFPLRPKPMGSC